VLPTLEAAVEADMKYPELYLLLRVAEVLEAVEMVQMAT
jgi:hypothetical protein